MNTKDILTRAVKGHVYYATTKYEQSSCKTDCLVKTQNFEKWSGTSETCKKHVSEVCYIFDIFGQYTIFEPLQLPHL